MQDTTSPVYGGFANPPPEYPLGIRITDKVSIKPIDRRSADRMYEAHHSYLPRGRCGWHYGVYLDNSIVGAISFDNWPSQASIHGYESDDIIEVSRVCIANNTPNLASCAMAKAQDVFLDSRKDIELLITYVREDYVGSMFAALEGKGWTKDKTVKGRNRGPHHGQSEIHEIYKADKVRWICEVDND